MIKVKRDKRNIGKAVEIVAPRTQHWNGTIGYIKGFRGNEFDPMTREAFPYVWVFVPRLKASWPFNARSLKYVDLPRHQNTAYWNRTSNTARR